MYSTYSMQINSFVCSVLLIHKQYFLTPHTVIHKHVAVKYTLYHFDSFLLQTVKRARKCKPKELHMICIGMINT